MEELKAPKANVLEIYKRVGPDGKQLLKDVFGTKAFVCDIKEWEAYIMDRVKYFEDACMEIGEDPLAPKFHEGEPDEIAYKKGKVIVQALNGPYILDYKDHNQRKWEAWLEHDGSGFRFRDVNYDLTYTYATGGSRLCYPSEEDAEYQLTQHTELYRDVMVFPEG